MAVFDKVRDILMDLMAVEAADVKPEASLVEDLGADSLDLVKFISALEAEFSDDGKVLEITDDDAAEVFTVGQVVEMLQKKGFTD